MSSIAAIAACLATLVFFAYHLVMRIVAWRRDERYREELKEIKGELEDEILHHGNTARIGQLRKRMLDLEGVVYGK